MGSGYSHERPPRIGVTWLRADEAAANLVVRAVSAAGGEAVPLLVEARSWTPELNALDGLILTGGNAIDPRRYGQENHGLCRVVIPRRDDLEMEAFRFCMDRAMPVLGICRGMQFINVAQGGSMLQDLSITVVEHEADGAHSRFHSVEVFPDTTLTAIVGSNPRLEVNSRHHQGLRPPHVAQGLRVSALAPDGVVEGVEAGDGRFLVGVQFHPEYPREVPRAAPLFDALVARAQQR